jgi:hypothetical protein
MEGEEVVSLKVSRFVVCIALVCCGAYVSASGQEKNPSQVAAQQAKENDIRLLLNDMGAGKLGAQMMDQMFGTMRTSMKQEVPEKVWDELIAEFKVEFSPEKLIELNVPIYDKHYTHDEIRQLISFYESPLGRKMISVIPSIAQESFDTGVAHARIVLQRFYDRLKSKGYEPRTL